MVRRCYTFADTVEIVMVLVGVVWGLGKGFAIVAAGTILGELANYLFVYSLLYSHSIL
jgi:uncharacterized membrane protein YdjX (TVP38/TMEM64 family)